MIRPWMQFHTRDWLDNKELRRCSPLARSVLADLMCLAHEGEPYGFLADKVGPLTVKYMSSRCVVTNNQFLKAVAELTEHGRLSTAENGTLFIPRMVEDEALRLKMAEGGRKGGNPSLVKREVIGEVNPTDNPTDKHARGQARSDSDSKKEVQEDAALPKPPRKCSAQWKQDEGFVRFASDYLGTGAALIDEDFAQAYEYCWKRLDFEQKLDRIAGLNRHSAEYHAGPRFVPKPLKFLETEWERPEKPPAGPQPIVAAPIYKQVKLDSQGNVIG